MNLLFICTHNRCRSVLSEALTNHFGSPKLTAYSAGSSPAGEVHPLTLKALNKHGISTAGLHSKSWDALDLKADQAPDLVITVCDQAAGESCPLWLGSTPKLHMGLADPSKLEGSEEQVLAEFDRVMEQIKLRISKFETLAAHKPGSAEFKEALSALEQQEL